MNSLEALFQPFSIRGMTLKNRIVMAPMGTMFANENGAVTRELIDYHLERTRGGVGLQIVEQAIINEERPSCMLSVGNDHLLAGLNDLTEAIMEKLPEVSCDLPNPMRNLLVSRLKERCVTLYPFSEVTGIQD